MYYIKQSRAVVTFAGQGTVLFGDKTAQSKILLLIE